MRMLNWLLPTLLIASPSPILADSNCDTTASDYQSILSCINLSLFKIDRKLNEQYQLLVRISAPPDRTLLISGERAWVSYRDSCCAELYDSTHPGNELELERVSCVASLTSDRLTELIYIETGVLLDNFYAAVGAMTSASLKQRKDILDHFQNKQVSPKGLTYIKINCELTNLVNNENLEECTARMKFKTM